MTRPTLRKFRVEAKLENKDGKKVSINFTIDATKQGQVWHALESMAKDANEDIVSAKISEVFEDGKEQAVTVRPNRDASMAVKETCDDDFEGWRWWEHEAFELVHLPTRNVEDYTDD